jgi:hypothetical protein
LVYFIYFEGIAIARLSSTIFCNGRSTMKIPVMSHYDSVENVDARDLKRLIASGSVLAFRRSERWVKIGADPVRGDGGCNYDGPERRNIIQKPISEEQKRAGHYCVLGVSGPPSEW